MANLVFGDDLPAEFALLKGVLRVKAGEDPKLVAKQVGSSKARLEALAAGANPVRAVFEPNTEPDRRAKRLERTRSMLGQLLIGKLAERVFEAIYKARMSTEELVLEDDRISRSDTDYRLLNGSKRPIFRINIKFHGTLFKNAGELVGLDPSDCFALATYKIHQAITKQEKEHLPYLFVVVGVPGLTGTVVGHVVPIDLVEFVAFAFESKVRRKRDFEDRVVDYLLRPGSQIEAELVAFQTQVAAAHWRVLSARRADRLLREKLFERVFAVRVRGFTSTYRRAEVDMHFSISSDLTPLDQFLDLVKKAGIIGVVSYFERGTF